MEFTVQHFAYETAISCNPMIHNFTGDKRKFDRSLIDQHFSMMFLWKYMNKILCVCVCVCVCVCGVCVCGHNILKEDVFITQLSSNAGIWVWWIVWFIINCCFMIDLVHLNTRTDFTRRATKMFMVGRNLAQFNDCLKGICKIDDRDQLTSTTHLSKEGRRRINTNINLLCNCISHEAEELPQNIQFFKRECTIHIPF